MWVQLLCNEESRWCRKYIQAFLFNTILHPLRLIAVPFSKYLGVKDRIRIRATSIPKLEAFYKQNSLQPSQVCISFCLLICLFADSNISICFKPGVFKSYSSTHTPAITSLPCTCSHKLSGAFRHNSGPTYNFRPVTLANNTLTDNVNVILVLKNIIRDSVYYFKISIICKIHLNKWSLYLISN